MKTLLLHFVGIISVVCSGISTTMSFVNDNTASGTSLSSVYNYTQSTNVTMDQEQALAESVATYISSFASSGDFAKSISILQVIGSVCLYILIKHFENSAKSLKVSNVTLTEQNERVTEKNEQNEHIIEQYEQLTERAGLSLVVTPSESLTLRNRRSPYEHSTIPTPTDSERTNYPSPAPF